MKALRVIVGLMVIFICMPIWYWLLYQILVRVHATDLMFFLFWVYVPVQLFAQALAKIAESMKEEK